MVYYAQYGPGLVLDLLITRPKLYGFPFRIRIASLRDVLYALSTHVDYNGFDRYMSCQRSFETLSDPYSSKQDYQDT